MSCKYHTWTRINGTEKTTEKFRRTSRSTSYKKIGSYFIVDTVSTRLLEKSRFKRSIGCFHFSTIREKTIKYGANGKKIEKIIIRNGNKKTIEYFRNYNDEMVKQKIDKILNSNDSSKIMEFKY